MEGDDSPLSDSLQECKEMDRFRSETLFDVFQLKNYTYYDEEKMRTNIFAYCPD